MLALAFAVSLVAQAGSPNALGSGSVYGQTQDAFMAQGRHDLTQLHHFTDGLRRLDELLKSHAELFHRSGRSSYTPDEKRLLLTTWGSFFNYQMAAELLRQRYWDFVKIPPGTQMHAFGYLLTH